MLVISFLRNFQTVVVMFDDSFQEGILQTLVNGDLNIVRKTFEPRPIPHQYLKYCMSK